MTSGPDLPLNARLRIATEADVEAIERLVADAYGKYVERIGRKPRPMVADYHAAVVKNQFWLCEQKGAPIAVLELVAQESSLLVQNIAVSPTFQQAGLGRSLMRFAEAEARRQGYGEVRLYTNERLRENLKFYGSLGYRETHREALGGTELVHMMKAV